MPVPREVKLLTYLMAPNSLLSSYLIIFVAGYLPSRGFPVSGVGLLLGIEGLTSITAAVPLGILSDKKGRRTILIAGNSLAVLAGIIFFFARQLYQYLTAAVLFGVAGAAVVSTWNAIVADRTDLADRAQAFSLTFVVSNVANSVGSALPFVFPYLEAVLNSSVERIHYLSLLALVLACAVSTVATVLVLRGYKELGYNQEKGATRISGLVLKLVISNSLIAFGAGLIIPFVPTWLLVKFGLQDSFSGPVLAAGGITIGFAASLSPFLAKKVGIVNAATATMASSLTFMASLAFISDPYVASLVYIVRTMLMNMSNPLMDTIVMSLASPESRGFISALVAIIWRIPNSASTILASILLGFVSFDTLWLLASVFYFAGISIFYVYFRNQKF